jgi:hypothetical protein
MLVLAWGVVLAVFVDLWSHTSMGRPFELRADALYGMAFPFVVGVICVPLGAMIDSFGNRPIRPLAYFNFGMMVALLWASLGLLMLAFGSPF